MPSTDGELTQAKSAARRRARALRQEAAQDWAAGEAGARIRDHAWASLRWPAPPAGVSAYWPMPEEADVRPLLEACHAAGYTCCLPVVVAKRQPLQFRRWTPATALETGTFGVPVPPGDAGEIVPSVLLVPLLAVDRRGMRLGFGGGFYDRTIAELRADNPELRAYGIALSCQVWETVPADSHDIRLDAVVTEDGVMAPQA